MATTIPGGVTSNVVGNTAVMADPAMVRMNQQRQWDLQDRNWGLREEERRRKDAEAMAAFKKNEAEAKMKAAYDKIYGASMQSNWDVLQGKMVGAPASEISGQKGPGYAPYRTVDPMTGQQTGVRGYQWRPDTNIPEDMFRQNLDAGYEMWKAMNMLGIEDPTRSTTAYAPGFRGGGGGSKSAGSTFSGPAGMEPPKQYQ